MLNIRNSHPAPLVAAGILASAILHADEATETVKETTAVWDILYGGSLVNLAIWLGLAITSFLGLWLIVDAYLLLKRDKLLPRELVSGVRSALSEGDLDDAFACCQSHPSPLANILMAAFSNLEDGYETVEQAVSAAAEKEAELLMQRVNYLNVCGQIAPMLGLMGTVSGMVMAFAGLARATGAAKAKMLAMSISTALWTTCVGLIIAVPALLFYTRHKNAATRLLLESEATVLDLIKVLRNVQMEE